MTMIEKMLQLIQSFPTLWEFSTDKKREQIMECFGWIGVDGTGGTRVEPVSFDAVEFSRWARKNGGGHGEQCAARFILSVWNPRAAAGGAYDVLNFDLHEALGCWDAAHRAAFTEWACAPWWP